MKRLVALLTVMSVVMGVTSLDAQAKRRYPRPPALPPIVTVFVDVGAQNMSVNVNGMPYGDWAVSTARSGYHTPRGNYRAIRLARVYYSKKYDNSPMPNSVFFYGGYAIHGTYHLKSLGRPASHGCVRLHPDHAEALYDLVKQYGMDRTRIVVAD